MSGPLDGRIAIVNGGARGIGAGIAEVFVEKGATVVVADTDAESARTTVERLSAKGTAWFRHSDVSSKADTAALVGAVVERHGRIDVLCQVAGIYPFSLLDDLPEEEWDRVLAVNLKGAFLAVQACMPAMKARRYGRIVFVSSITGPRVAFPGHGHYCASKAGLIGLVRSAALELAPFGITVNAVEPGNIETEQIRRVHGEAHFALMARSVPLGRLGTVREVGYACAFLASDEAAYITGTSLVLDGGQILPEAKVD
ncbi:MAG: SDR family oxidoreductase [Rhodospirillaceae bacterium]|nr:SDR family oxidoreductase [Rhodospirillaceae bacterium]